MIIKPDLVVTTLHEIEDHGVVQASTYGEDKRSFELALLGVDPAKDLAFFRITRGVPDKTAHLNGQNAPTPNISNGEAVFALGFPQDCQCLRVVASTVARRLFYRFRFFTLADTVEITSALANGMSGGPVVNAQGELLGIIHGMRPRGLFIYVEEIKNSLRYLESRALSR